MTKWPRLINYQWQLARFGDMSNREPWELDVDGSSNKTNFHLCKGRVDAMTTNRSKDKEAHMILSANLI